MELILHLVKIIVTVVLVGVSVMFLRLLDALVVTPKRIRSQLQIQPITRTTPPSSLAPNNTQFKGKQILLRINLISGSVLGVRFNAYVFTEGNTDFAEEASGYGRKWVRQRGYDDDNVVSPWRYVCKCEYRFPKLVNFKKDDEDDLVRASVFIRWLTSLFLQVSV
ncbi:hypothetical protein J1N35_029519 [Gossypium stocksii]|uniref:Uncharacterized protein n=1 Tax=Gossypium stocksii TaxID=47602 RepID=A0A9D3UXX1_9ROSI|nr:hypothetical protein J1N35_029519 [Gossypium stocksii]